MRRFAAGVMVGGVLVMGVAQGLPNPGEWRRAPMKAGTETFLYEHGYCQKDFRLRHAGDRTSNRYICVPKGYP